MSSEVLEGFQGEICEILRKEVHDNLKGEFLKLGYTMDEFNSSLQPVLQASVDALKVSCLSLGFS